VAKKALDLSGRPGKVAGREYLLVDLPYIVARDLLRVEQFDHDTGRGYQRGLDEKKASSLAAEMREGRYTPAGLSASLTDRHKISRTDDGVVTVKNVSHDAPLACVDGQHRLRSMAILHAESPDEWADVSVPLLLLLDHAHQATDFLNLQRGNAVSRNLMRSLEFKSGMIDDENVGFATEVVGRLAADRRSFMANGVAYVTNDKRKLQYSTLISSGGSTLGTTVYGGAKIAREFGRSPDWLADVYTAGWTYLQTHLTPLDPDLGEESIRKALSTGRLLEPLSQGGNRGGTHLLLGIFNLLAWRTGYAGLDKPGDEDLKRLADTVDWLWADAEFDGGSAPTLREHLGEFAQAYYKDFKGPKTLGIPNELVNVLSPSTLNLDAKQWRAARKGVKPGEPVKRGRGRPRLSDEEKAARKAAKKSEALKQREAAAARIAAQMG
jgi:hypothetical protein